LTPPWEKVCGNEWERKGKRQGERSFPYADAVEKVHQELYRKALEHLEKLKGTDDSVYSVYGYTREKEPPGRFPVADAKAKPFFSV